MHWLTNFLTSSIGQKLIMSLTGLFLILFLPVHLAGNLQLLYDDGGEAFNKYAFFMTHNPLIKTLSYGLYFFILVHALQGILLFLRNSSARGSVKYAVKKTKTVGTSSFASKNMGWLGIITLVFIILHMGDFWRKMKMGILPQEQYDGMSHTISNLYLPVEQAFTNPAWVAFYVICMIVIGFHLWHGFASSFQTLGINHKKYSPFIKFLGKLYAILIPLGFAYIPIYFFIKHS